MTPRDLIADAVLTNKKLVARYLAGFTDQSCTAQATNLPNHVSWSLGHLALTMHRVAEKVDGQGPPSSDFGAGSSRTTFNTEAVAFGSKPAADAAAYPSLARSIEIFDAAADRLAAVARGAPDSKFNEIIKWGPVEAPWWSLVVRMVFHNGFHTGQIADLRRALGMKSIFS
jgi:hypothetical protein